MIGQAERKKRKAFTFQSNTIFVVDKLVILKQMLAILFRASIYLSNANTRARTSQYNTWNVMSFLSESISILTDKKKYISMILESKFGSQQQRERFETWSVLANQLKQNKRAIGAKSTNGTGNGDDCDQFN